MPDHSPLLLLPAEILLQVFSRLADVRSLLNARSVCKLFEQLISDTGLWVDVNLWHPCAVSLLSDCTPVSHPFDTSWRAFLRRAALLSGFPSSSALEPGALLPYVYERLDCRLSQCLEPRLQQIPHRIAPPHLPKSAEILFLHSSTEASRTCNGPYFGVKGSFFLFSDDPDDAGPGDFERGCVSAGGEIKRLEAPDNMDVKTLKAAKFYRAASARQYIKSCMHSDSDLVLHYAQSSSDSKFHPKRIRRIGPDPKEWNFSTTGNLSDLNFTEPSLEVGVIWEFRSCGDFLINCDDRNSYGASTITCFRAARAPSPPLWLTPVLAPRPGYFYDNDGIRVTTRFVVYGTRSMLSLNHPQGGRRSMGIVVAKFLLYDIENGQLIRTLDFGVENRLCQGSYSWCSFAVSDTLVAATFGGELPHRSRRFQYGSLLVWDLCRSENDPVMMGKLPERWGVSINNSYVAISGCGRVVFVTVDWECIVWDVATKRCIGKWQVEGKTHWLTERNALRWERCDGWNGLWIVYQDRNDVGVSWMPGRTVRNILKAQCRDT